MTSSLTAAALLRWGAAQLVASATPMLDARLLLLHVTGMSHAAFLLHQDVVLNDDCHRTFCALVDRRRAGEPIAYILGYQEFFGRRFVVSPDVLIPRPETEMLVAAAIDQQPKRVLDLGVGSGCILGSILAECPRAEGEGWDLSLTALEMARQNLAALCVMDRATLRHRTFSDATPTPYDVIVSNPPYIEAAAPLPLSVAGFEPASALFAGADGMAAYRVLAPTLAAMLAPDGVGFLEIGAGQGEAVADLMRTAMPRRSVHVERDLASLDRMVVIGPEKSP